MPGFSVALWIRQVTQAQIHCLMKGQNRAPQLPEGEKRNHVKGTGGQGALEQSVSKHLIEHALLHLPHRCTLWPLCGMWGDGQVCFRTVTIQSLGTSGGTV